MMSPQIITAVTDWYLLWCYQDCECHVNFGMVSEPIGAGTLALRRQIFILLLTYLLIYLLTYYNCVNICVTDVL